ncbi:baseplate assembly protein [Chelatococcus asaccharovorans]|uniref:Phage-related baseplate assembly protein n=1 Tax=Chelatococcus asaccharovorans TaxID=28210 RepID=A0A2V3UAW4_9HYPH|nr:baseplate J/gp47 family protein [Chelatococcus asaccharovorans]MBS7703320.1 baseplate J/gp47 family protein [Chelatococcus asaccharovorans]PXW61653.1 phage-related baseplate assembly protein [Chelatococcus asaccharovorans]
MTRFTASTLDLSSLDPASLWPALTFQGFTDERIHSAEGLLARLSAAGIPFNVENLESDITIKGQETSAYRELLAHQAMRDIALDLTVAFGRGRLLDLKGIEYGTTRLVVTPAMNGADAVMESDDRFRARIQLAPEAFGGAGTPGGYIYHATATSPDVHDVGVVMLGRGTPNVTVELTIMSASGNGEPSDSLLEDVRRRMLSENIKMLTDVVTVRRAVAIPYTIAAVLHVPSGPDPEVIRQAAITSVNAMASRYQRLAGGVPHSAVVAALHVGGVDHVTDVTPTNDVLTERYQFGRLTGVNVSIQVLRG